ncbi:hypothetical protein SAMN05216559_1597 [Halomicrobium zhouii]|uniref:Uncharacterized protein n=1 Tax=Halomicrobium zhouii TaxID=767519 RepID=A0A1I6KYY9_9EURY|nr:hypothetical protein [Halomicrobium zhouii]SFR96439.1 hypothetical protein SAMN05216559_1597 [Halomicrobium zhouii]
MQGLPDPLFGSIPANWGIAVAVALVLVALPLRYRRSDTPLRIAAASGVLAAGVGLALWAVPRLWLGTFRQFSFPDLPVAIAVYGIGTLLLAVQVAGPVYGYLEYGLVSPLAVALTSTTLSTFLHFQLGGETESFALYAVFAPWVLGTIVGLALLESGARRYVIPRVGSPE